MNDQTSDVSQLLRAVHTDRGARSELMPLVYGELRRLAGARMRLERPDHSLQPTELVHEAYLRLVEAGDIAWQGRSHFFAMAATMMRRILVDQARASLTEKRGARSLHVELQEAIHQQAAPGRPERDVDVLALDGAMLRLARMSERQARVVELRFFGGLSEAEAGDVLQVSERTVKRDWRVARAWLYKELSTGDATMSRRP